MIFQIPNLVLWHPEKDSFKLYFGPGRSEYSLTGRVRNVLNILCADIKYRGGQTELFLFTVSLIPVISFSHEYCTPFQVWQKKLPDLALPIFQVRLPGTGLHQNQWMAVCMCKYTHGHCVVVLYYLLRYMSHKRSVRFEIKCIVCVCIIILPLHFLMQNVCSHFIK